MSATSFLKLPFIIPAQAQKHVTHNEALSKLDVITQLSCKSLGLDVAPASVQDSDRYIISPEPTGIWENHANKIAIYQQNDWTYIEPNEGWRVWVTDQSLLYIYTQGSWQKQTSETANIATNVPHLGINADTDSYNKLTLKSDSALFSHDDITPGSGDMRVSVNKLAGANTASLLFQCNYQAHAEIGLIGDNQTAFKVSPDGSTWYQAFSVDNSSGAVSFPNTAQSENSGTLTVSGSGGNNNVANSATLSVETDPFNPNTSAFILRPGGANARFIFGDSNKKFFSLNLTHVNSIENMPSFATPDALRFGYSALSGHVIGRLGNSIEYHACAPTNGGHKFFAKSGAYNRSGETLTLEIMDDSIQFHVPAHFEAPPRLPSYDTAALPAITASSSGDLILVNPTSGEKFVAFCDGTNWRRVDDRSLI